MATSRYMDNKKDIRYLIHYLHTEYNIKKHLTKYNQYKHNYIIAAITIKNFIVINNYGRKNIKITKKLLINLFNYVKKINYQTYQFLKCEMYKLSKIYKKSNINLN